MENGPGVSLPGYLLICYSQQAVSISLQMKNCSLTQQILSKSQRRSIQSASSSEQSFHFGTETEFDSNYKVCFRLI